MEVCCFLSVVWLLARVKVAAREFQMRVVLLFVDGVRKFVGVDRSVRTGQAENNDITVVTRLTSEYNVVRTAFRTLLS